MLTRSVRAICRGSLILGAIWNLVPQQFPTLPDQFQIVIAGQITLGQKADTITNRRLIGAFKNGRPLNVDSAKGWAISSAAPALLGAWARPACSPGCLSMSAKLPIEVHPSFSQHCLQKRTCRPKMHIENDSH
ncbi:MAG: hypothetical protein KDB00_00885 [Planctomycetales bacterium]|nr:hypothetical protein [Planctomycetales bacterium]